MRKILFLLLLLPMATTPAFSQTETHPFTLYTAAQYPAIRARLSREPYQSWMTRLTEAADEVRAKNVDWTDGTISKVTQGMYGKLLAAAYALTGSEAPNHREYGEEAAECLANVPSSGFKSWFINESDLGVSEAAVYWAEAYDLLKGAGFDFTVDGFPGMEETIRGNLSSLRHYMAQNKGSIFGSPTGTLAGDFSSGAFWGVTNSDNHHVKLFAALTVLSLSVYNESGSEGDYSTAFTQLFACLKNLTITGGNGSPAGGWGEGPAYHEYTAQQYLPALTALENLDLFDYSTLPEVVNTHLLIPQMALPDGYLPPWDDNEAKIADMAGLYASRHRTLTDSGGLLWLWNLNGQPVNLAFLPDYLAQFDDTMPAPASPESLGWNPSEFFPETGFARFRSSWEPDARCLLLLSEHGEARISGQAHEHPDPNSFILHAYGEMLILDSGYGGFSQHDSTRFAVNHNLILTDGEGPQGAAQSEIFGIKSFWIANGADASLGNRFSTPGLDYALSTTSYAASGGTTSFTRQVIFPGQRYFLLYDRAAADRQRTFTMLLHGNGGGSSGGTFTPLEGGGLWSRDKASLRSFTVGTNDLTPGPATLGFETQDLAHAVYQRSPLQNHTVLKVSQQGVQGRFLTLLFPRKTGEAMPAPAALSVIPPERGTGIRLALGDTTDYSVIRERGSALAFTAGADTISSDGEMVWCRIGPDHTIAQFLVVNGTSLSLGEASRLTASVPVTLSADFRDPLAVKGYVVAGPAGAVLSLTQTTPARVTFKGAEVAFTVTGGDAQFRVTGAGEWRVDAILQPPFDGRVEDVPNDQGHSLRLTWKASPSAGDGLVDSYRILRSRSPLLTDPIPLSRFTTLDSLLYYEERYTILIGAVPADTLQFIDPFVPLNDTPYYYWVQVAGGGALSKPAKVSVPVSVETTAPRRFLLGPAYPNPFNPSTTLSFTLPEEVRAVITIYTVTGQRVAILLDRLLGAGTHRITWDAAGYPSGVYLYTLSAGGRHAAGKMLLLK